ncbi:hypothetical protein FHS89_002109 [Rubricella aquisinus]|uniref:Uncharacterized protein n=1 Tax=Rubricella aquisinus TaxID=2028108 RepID=A0A840WPU1_9RHOB|nr:hypothetical protein [Rubricella aquisinus]MBB5516083.1 hypothetical protein [Rubricella aquisinus]
MFWMLWAIGIGLASVAFATEAARKTYPDTTSVDAPPALRAAWAYFVANLALACLVLVAAFYVGVIVPAFTVVALWAGMRLAGKRGALQPLYKHQLTLSVVAMLIAAFLGLQILS